MRKLKSFIVILFLCFAQTLKAQQICSGAGSSDVLPTKCFEIENILVNACTSNEGYDEMVRLRVGPNPLTLNSITTVVWPTVNSWLGWATYTTTTLGKLTTINNTISAAGNCGRLIKLNPTDVAPPYARILIITSKVFSVAAIDFDFSGLKDTLYVAMQNNSSVTLGHFTNSNVGVQSLSISTSSCNENVSWNTDSLTSGDGSSVKFTFSGTPTYYNNGCAIPNTPYTVDAGTTAANYCSGNTVSLTGAIAGAACFYWYPQNRAAGAFSDSTSLVTQFNIATGFTGAVKLYLRANASCTNKLDSVMFNVVAASGSISITPTTDTVRCNKNILALTATTSSANPVTWSTIGKGTYSSTSSLTTSYTPSVNDTTSVWFSVTQNQSCGSVKDSIRIRFTASPKPLFTPTDSLFCISQAATVVSLNPLVAGGIFSGTGVSGNTFVVPSTAGTYAIKYVISLNGCSDSLTRYMVVTNSISASFSVSDTFVCLGTKSITVTPTNPGGIFSGLTLVGNVFTPTVPGIFVISYKIGSGPCIDSVGKRIYVSPQPNAGFTATDSLFCLGQGSATFTPSTLGGVFSGTHVSGSIFTPLSIGTHAVKYVVTHLGCTDSTTKNMLVQAMPNASFSVSDTFVCLGTKSITVTPTNPGGIFSGLTLVGNVFTPTVPGIFVISYKIGSGPCIDSVGKRIYVSPQPNAGFTATDSLFCLGQGSATFTPSTLGGVFSGTHVSGSIFTPLSIGTHAVKYVVTHLGCTDSTTKNMLVQAMPNASFSVSDTFVCLGTKSITVTPTNPGGIFSGVTLVGNVFTPTVPGIFVISYKIGSGPCIDSVGKRIYVSPQPNAGFAATDSLFCLGQGSATFTPSTLGGVFSGTHVSGSIYTPLSIGTHAVKYVVTQLGCSDSTTKNMLVQAIPNASFTATDTLVCEGSVPITLTPINAGGTFSGVGVTGNLFTPSTSGSFPISYVLNNGTCKDSVVHIILVSAKPDADFTLSDTVLCEGDLPVTINTNTAGGVFSGATLTANQFIPTTPGIYTLTYLVNNNGCQDSVTHTIVVNAKPVAAFSVSSSVIMVNDTVTFTYTGGSSVNQYFWRFGDGNTANQASPITRYSQDKSYSVWLTVTNSEGCLDSIMQTIKVDAEENIFVPNVFTPNLDTYNDLFEIAHMGIYNYHIYIYNRWGGLVYESNNPDGGWDGKSNGSFCPESVYVFLITYQNSKQITKSMHGTVTLIR